MPSNKGSNAPSSISEGLQGIAAAVNAAMMAPDAAPFLKFLEGLQKATLGAIHGGRQGPQQGQPGQGQSQQAQPGQPPAGGGTNLGQLMGGAPSGPSAGPAQGPATTSPSGISADDLRRSQAAQAQMAS